MKKNLMIIGASGHGKVVLDIALSMGKWDRIEFLDDYNLNKQHMGFDIVGKTTESINYKTDFEFIVAIGNNDARKKIQEKLINESFSVATMIHPSSIIGARVEIGVGTVVMPGVIINSSCKLGKGCIVNTSSSLDHDDFIEDYVHISPGVHLAGNVKIGCKSWICIGASVINNINICSGCIIGAGAVVINDIIEEGIYVGVPAKKISV